jgi:N-methylhydantoinase A
MPRFKMKLGQGREAKGVEGGWKGKRKVFFAEESRFIDTPVYDRYLLKPGDRFAGPAVVEERESTVVAGPRSDCFLDPLGNLIILLQGV